MSKHTSGPWYRVADQIFSNEDMTDLIAEVQGGSGTQYIDDDCNAECLANCKLIEAAPDLYDALRTMLDVFGDDNQHLQQDAAIRQAVEACRKVDPESNYAC